MQAWHTNKAALLGWNWHVPDQTLSSWMQASYYPMLQLLPHFQQLMRQMVQSQGQTGGAGQSPLS
jgi:hypothetical protein